MDFAEVDTLLSQLDLNMSKSVADVLMKIQKKIIRWLKCSRAQRQYYGKTKAELLAETRKRNIKWGSNPVTVKRAVGYEWLLRSAKPTIQCVAI